MFEVTWNTVVSWAEREKSPLIVWSVTLIRNLGIRIVSAVGDFGPVGVGERGGAADNVRSFSVKLWNRIRYRLYQFQNNKFSAECSLYWR